MLILEVIETDPGLKGDTAQGGSKPATLSTGVVVKVPLFVYYRSETITIDTLALQNIKAGAKKINYF